MLSILHSVMMLCVSFTTWSQPARGTSYSITIADSVSTPRNHDGYRTDSFLAGGSCCPAIRADIEFHFRSKANTEVLVRFPNEDNPRPAILMRVSLVEVECHQVVSSVLLELNNISPDCRTIRFSIGARASQYQLWFQDSWEENVNGTRRIARGASVNWDGTIVTVYPSVSNTDEVIPMKPTRRGFKVD
jgi:hypothetical protein